MTSSEIRDRFPHLSEDERKQALEIQARINALQADLECLLKRRANEKTTIDLGKCGIGEPQAKDLRARLRTFAQDWERPEADIYDEP